MNKTFILYTIHRHKIHEQSIFPRSFIFVFNSIIDSLFTIFNRLGQAVPKHNNEQSLPVGAVRIIFMTVSKHKDKQICSISRVSFLSESLTSNGLPKHLDIMVYKATGLRVDVFQYHLSSHGKLKQMDKFIYRFIGFIYWLFLFIGFIYSIWWLYLLDLSIGFIHWLYLFNGFIYSTWWLYLLDLSIGFIYQFYLCIDFIYSTW